MTAASHVIIVSRIGRAEKGVHKEDYALPQQRGIARLVAASPATISISVMKPSAESNDSSQAGRHAREV